MVHRLMGGQAALMIANTNTNAVAFFSDTPMKRMMEYTIAPRTNTETLPAPVMAPGISIRTAMQAISSHLLPTWDTSERVMAVMEPLIE